MNIFLPLINFIKEMFRFRNIYLYTVTILTITLLFLADPDNAFVQKLPWGSSTIATLLMYLKAVIAVTFLHFTRKAMFDYIDMEDIYKKAMQSDNATASSLFAIAVSVFVLAFAILIAVSI